MTLLKHNPEYIIPQLKTPQRISISHSEIQNAFRIYKDLSHLPPATHSTSSLCTLAFAYPAVCSHTGNFSVFPEMYRTSFCTRPFPWCSYCLECSFHGHHMVHFLLPSLSSFSLCSDVFMREDFPGHLN